MTEASVTKTIPDYSRFGSLMKASFIAIFVDLFLVFFKYFLSVLSGNTLLLADALHSGGDFSISVLVLVSIVINHSFPESPKAKRAEAIVSFLISLALIIGSIQMFLTVFSSKTTDFHLSSSIPLVISIAGVSVILGITLFISRYKAGIGKKYNSIAFTAESYHTYSDFLTSFGVWVTLLLGYFGIQFARIMSFIIAIVVFQVGLRLLVKSIRLIRLKFTAPARLKNIISPDLRKSIKDRVFILSHKLKGLLHSVSKFQVLPVDFLLSQPQKVIAANIILILGLYVGTGFYMVLPYQTGLELRFGSVIAQNAPGLHFHLPEPIGRSIRVDTGVAIRLESGFRTDLNYVGEEPPVYLWEYSHQEGMYSKKMDEALAISGDENLADVNFLCYYRIIDPVKYALGIQNPHELLRSIFTHKSHAVLGHQEMDKMLTRDRKTVQLELFREMEKEVSQLPLGVTIESVYMQEAHPPLVVIPQYRAVASAREKKDYFIHEAVAYGNDLLPRTRGDAASIILDSQAYAEERIMDAKGQTDQFLSNQMYYAPYKKAQKVRMRWEALEEVMKKKPIFVIPRKAKRRIYLSKSQ